MTTFAEYLTVALGNGPTSPEILLAFNAVKALVILLLALWLSTRVRRAVDRRLHLGRGDDANQLRLYRRVISTVIWVPAIGIAIHILGIDMTPLFATGGVMALAIGFGAKDFAANFISGIVLRTERYALPGNVIDFNGDSMVVRRVGLRAVTTDAYGGRDMVIPNATLLQSVVGTFTGADKNVRLSSTVRVNLTEDPKVVYDVLLKAATTCSSAHGLPSPDVRLAAFKEDALEFNVRIWVNSPGKIGRGLHDLNVHIWQALAEASIPCALPKRMNFTSQVEGPVALTEHAAASDA